MARQELHSKRKTARRREPVPDLNEQIRDLRDRLADSEETLRAIREGEVDAVVVSGPAEDRVYTLRGADESYRIFVQQMTEGAVTLSREGDILYANAQFAALVGAQLEEVIGSRFLDFVVDRDAELFENLLIAEFASSSRTELRLQDHDGTQIPVYVSAGSLMSEELQCFCVVVVDVREQKRNEEIAAAERLARSILDAATEPMVVLDLNGRIIRANEAAHTIAGRNTLLQPFEAAFTFTVEDASVSIIERLLWAARRSGHARPMEATVVRASGEESDVAISAGPLQGPGGESLGWVVTLADITRQKRIERELRASNEDLQRYAYAISHDLREPLRTIGSFTQLLAKNSEAAGSEARDYVGFIVDGVKRMEKLIDGLLTYSRVSHGPPEQRVQTDCDAMLRFALGHLEAAIKRSGAIVTFDPLPVVEANDGRMLQVFQNLIGNAIKYRSHRSPEIHISAKASGEEWIFSVRDNGMGLDMAYAGRIFGVFQRLHSSSEIEGAGIGLAIVKRIIERHGGRVWVESEPGAGSTFYFTLPRSDAPLGTDR